MVNSTKERSLFFYEVQLENSFFCYVIDHRSIPYLGVLNTPIILSFMLLPPRDMSEAGHPNRIEWDDSFSFRICKIKISIKSHIAVY